MAEINTEVTTSAVVFEKARELGKAIENCDIKQRNVEASNKLLKDAEATELINNYNIKREQKMKEFEGKQPTPEEARAANDYLQKEFEKIVGNAVIKEYLEAAQAYETMLAQMDSILKHFIVGEQESDCTGSCSTCGGCH